VTSDNPESEGDAHGRQVRNQQGPRRQIPVPPQGPERRNHAASQGYETKVSAEKGIQAIKTHAPNAAVEDHTEANSS
jgi:hypothetical protein